MSMVEIKLDGSSRDIFAEDSIPASHTLNIQNKTNGRISIWLGTAAPVDADKRNAGFVVKVGDCFQIPPNSATKCFVTGNGPITVHHY